MTATPTATAGLNAPPEIAADRERAGHDRHADGQSVEGIAGGALGGGGIHHHVSQREGEQKLRHESRRDILDLHRRAALADQEDRHQRGHDAGGHLGHPVGNDVLGFTAAADEHGQGDGGIVVRAGDVAAGEDHDHQRRADGQRRNDAGRARNDGAADGEHEEERADEFSDVFVHGFPGLS